MFQEGCKIGKERRSAVIQCNLEYRLKEPLKDPYPGTQPSVWEPMHKFT